MKFANTVFPWFNSLMKNSGFNITDKLTKKYLVSFIIGTRPEAIKLSPLIQQLKQEKFLRIRVILTGQDSEMVAQVLSLFKIKEDEN